MLGVGLVYSGLIACLFGAVSLVRPLSCLGMHRRRAGASVLALGVASIVLGWALPAKEVRRTELRTQLDRFAPVYQFNEVHSTHVTAPRDRVYRAIQSVTA